MLCVSFEVSNEPFLNHNVLQPSCARREQEIGLKLSSVGLLETLKIKAVEIEFRASEYAYSTSYNYGDINIKIENDTGKNEGKKRRCYKKATLKLIFLIIN